MKTAATAYLVEHKGVWPADSTVLAPYLSALPEATYTFNVDNGLVTSATGGWADQGLTLSTATQMWQKAPQ